MADDDKHEWKIRSMLTAKSKAAMVAAGRAGKSNAEWVAEAIDEKLMRERTPVAGEVFGPKEPEPRQTEPFTPLYIDDLEAAARLWLLIAEKRGTKIPKRGGHLGTINRLLGERLKAEPVAGKGTALVAGRAGGQATVEEVPEPAAPALPRASSPEAAAE